MQHLRWQCVIFFLTRLHVRGLIGPLVTTLHLDSSQQSLPDSLTFSQPFHCGGNHPEEKNTRGLLSPLKRHYMTQPSTVSKTWVGVNFWLTTKGRLEEQLAANGRWHLSHDLNCTSSELMLKPPTPSDNSRKIKKHKPCSFKVLVLSPFLSEDTHSPVLLIKSFRFKSIGLPGSTWKLLDGAQQSQMLVWYRTVQVLQGHIPCCH